MHTDCQPNTNSRCCARLSPVVWATVLSALVFNTALVSATRADTLQTLIDQVDTASVLLIDPAGDVNIAINADQALIPASTAKLALSWLALQAWGDEYQFETRFTVESPSSEQPDVGRLWIKASGDPFLVSEDLVGLAGSLSEALTARGVQRIEGIGIDPSLFAEISAVPGGTRTTNPYDALPSALAANFNTLVLKIDDEHVVVGEEQTPVTPTTLARARELGLLDGASTLDPTQVHRVNLGFSHPERAARYFSELLVHFLEESGVEVSKDIAIATGESRGQELLRYTSRRSMMQILQAMLTYSNNFIANQLALAWAASRSDVPANFEHFSRHAEPSLSEAFVGSGLRLVEGAGLSRDNRLSARQLVSVVEALHEYPGLLPEYIDGVFAKTGTLTGVSALAGYIDEQTLAAAVSEETARWSFALLVNDPEIADASWRDAVLKELIERVKAAAERDR